jgi:hypothetical protein
MVVRALLLLLVMSSPVAADLVPCEQLSHPDSRAGCLRDRVAAAANAERAIEAERAEVEARGPLRGYLWLVAARFRVCSTHADDVIDGTTSGADLAAVAECASKAEIAATERIKSAIVASPPPVLELVKGLHAYAIASFRALSDYSQSPIEMRRDRAARRAAIDERIARIELDL